MSYNVDHIEIIENESAHFTLGDWENMIDKIWDELPESSFAEDMADGRGRPVKIVDGVVPIQGDSFSWTGTGSGHKWDLFEKEVLPLIKGKLELLATWESGDTIEIITIDNGKVSKENAKARLRRQKK
jgi:hypothetical protein